MIERIFDLTIATVSPGEPAPPEAHLVRMDNPPLPVVESCTREGWYYKSRYVMYVLPVPQSLELYLEAFFRSGSRWHVKRLLREVPKRYRLHVDEEARWEPQFRALYQRTIVGKPRGIDRLGEHEHDFTEDFVGYYLFDGEEMVAGVLAHRMLRHLSVAYGAFDPEHRRHLDLEHFLIIQVLERSIAERNRYLSLGIDTNRYGHHLSLGIAPYKMRLGFTPCPYESGGWELMRIQSWEPFASGLFFYSWEDGRLVGNLFHRDRESARRFAYRTAPPIVWRPVGMSEQAV